MVYWVNQRVIKVGREGGYCLGAMNMNSGEGKGGMDGGGGDGGGGGEMEESTLGVVKLDLELTDEVDETKVVKRR